MARTSSAVPSVTSSEAGVETGDNRNQVSGKLVISFSYHGFSLICHTYSPPTGNGHNHSFCPKDTPYLGVQKQRLAKQSADDCLREPRDLSQGQPVLFPSAGSQPWGSRGCLECNQANASFLLTYYCIKLPLENGTAS